MPTLGIKLALGAGVLVAVLASKAPAHPSQTSTSCRAGSKVSSPADATNFSR